MKGIPHPMLMDERVAQIMKTIKAGLEAHLAALSVSLTPDDARRIARAAIRVDVLRQRAWGMDNQKARSLDAKALRIALQQAERELDEAIAGLRDNSGNDNHA